MRENKRGEEEEEDRERRKDLRVAELENNRGNIRRRENNGEANIERVEESSV